jgi:uncharacterized membrane protein
MPEPEPGPPEPASQNPPESEAVWTFRGYRLRPSEFTTAMVHLFRAEITRANVWRQRLDTTTNWAVVTTGAAITIAFNASAHHGVILLNTLLVTLFLYIEARRYRYYELWSYRVRLMETDFFASMLVPPFHPAPDWAEALAEHLLHPSFPISMWEAFGRRFRRNYMWIYIILALAWLVKSWLLMPQPATNWGEFFRNVSIGTIPGWIVLFAGLLFNGVLFLIGGLTATLHQATGEVLPRYIQDFKVPSPLDGSHRASESLRAWFRQSRRRQQLLALIITDRSEAVGQQILTEMKRGVTAMEGKGMYTGQQHSVLMCALTVTEVPQLKALVSAADPEAFVIVSPAQEVLGKGFNPLKPKEE